MEANNQFSDSTGTELLDLASDHLITSTQVWLEASDVMNKDVATMPPDGTAVKAAEMMAQRSISSVIVVDAGSIAGILTETDLLRRVAAKDMNLNEMTVSQIMSWPVEVIPPDISALDASVVMDTKHIKRLPVVDDGRLVGIVTQTDLVQVLTSYGMWKNVQDIMSKDVAEIQRKAPVAEAAQIMASKKISCIVILDGDDVVGVFTERDLLKRVVALQKDAVHTKMEEVMSSSVMSVPPNYSVLSAKKTMENTNIRRLVVMEDEKLCGIVTQTDILTAMKNKLQEEEEKNLSLLEKSKSSIYTMDLDGKITYVNPAFTRLLKVPDTAELIDHSFLPQRFWVNPEEKIPLLRELKKGNIETRELALKTSKGGTIYVTLFSTLTKNVHGQINGIQGTLHDITERKEAEDNLKQEIARRKEAEAKLRSFRVKPKVVKKWYKTEDAYRNAVKALQGDEPFASVKGHLRNAVGEAVAALKSAGKRNTEFKEVRNLFGLLDTPKVTAKKAVNETRRLLNWLGRKAPPEAGLWFIEQRGDDE